MQCKYKLRGFMSSRFCISKPWRPSLKPVTNHLTPFSGFVDDLMALCGIECVNWSVEGVDLRCLSTNSCPVRARCVLIGRRRGGVRCNASRRSAVLGDNGEVSGSMEEEEEDEELGIATRFEMDDFDVSDRVSIGLGRRADEVVFEAIVKNSNSPLHNTRVVLRELTNFQAQRRGKQAIEVLRKLARRRFLYHSYSMQVHGYISTPSSGDSGSFMYHGSFSLRHWLQQSDWLPTLEATLALDEEPVRTLGDDSVGGPAVSRQLRLICLLMRDLLIGELMEPSHFTKFKIFLMKILDRNWGAGWNLLALLLATKPSQRTRHWIELRIDGLENALWCSSSQLIGCSSN
ncbi:putative plastid-lipid-associated protein 14, chloroplastic [Drosera capensis]